MSRRSPRGRARVLVVGVRPPKNTMRLSVCRNSCFASTCMFRAADKGTGSEMPTRVSDSRNRLDSVLTLTLPVPWPPEGPFRLVILWSSPCPVRWQLGAGQGLVSKLSVGWLAVPPPPAQCCYVHHLFGPAHQGVPRLPARHQWAFRHASCDQLAAFGVHGPVGSTGGQHIQQGDPRISRHKAAYAGTINVRIDLARHAGMNRQLLTAAALACSSPSSHRSHLPTSSSTTQMGDTRPTSSPPSRA